MKNEPVKSEGAKPKGNAKYEAWGKKPVGWYVETKEPSNWAELTQEQRMASAHAHEQKWKKRYTQGEGKFMAQYSIGRG